MRTEESIHRRRLLVLFRQKVGDHIPLLRRQDVRGFVRRNPVWLIRPLGLETVRNQASEIEVETRNFYERAAHEDRAGVLEKDKLSPGVKHREDQADYRLFVLQIVQLGLAGLIDGFVSTLARVRHWFRHSQQWGCVRGRPGSIYLEPASAWARMNPRTHIGDFQLAKIACVRHR
jgi:erythrin-vacuolar iron transport family protein